MKIIFLFDQLDAEGKVVSANTNPYVVAPENLQMKQLAPGQTGIGLTVSQKNEKGEDVQQFVSIIQFPVNTIPALPTLDAEIEYLKSLLTQKIAAQSVEAEVAKAKAAAATVAPAPAAEAPKVNGAAKPKKAKKSSK